MNRVILAGRLARDMYEVKGGKTFFGTVATEAGWDKEKKEPRVHFVPFVTFQLSEAQMGLFKKGAPVVLEGEVHNRTLEKDGDKVYKTEVVVHRGGMRLLGQAKNGRS